MKSRLIELREEIVEVNSAICVAWVIIMNKRKGRGISPDDVNSEYISMSEVQFTQLSRLPIVLVDFLFEVDLPLGKPVLYEDDLLPTDRCLPSLRNKYDSRQWYFLMVVDDMISLLPDVIKDCLTWGVSVIPFNRLEIVWVLHEYHQ